MYLGTCLADKGAESDIEMRALSLATVNTVSIEGILDEQCIDKLGLLSRLALENRLGRGEHRSGKKL